MENKSNKIEWKKNIKRQFREANIYYTLLSNAQPLFNSKMKIVLNFA